MRIRIAGLCVMGGLVLAATGAREAAARPQYAAREGMPCISCHVDPAGGGQRNGNGFAYARGRHAFDVEPKFEEWKAEPEVAKGVRLGADLRYVGMSMDQSFHDSDAGELDQPTTVASYAMQGAAYLSLVPVEQLVVYYSHDVAAGSPKQRDFWGMVRNITPINLYVKAGQIRPPYGARTEDHTPFVRGAVQAPPGERGIMDVDPRTTHPGVEVGFVKSGAFASVAYQDPNGTASPNFTEMKEKMVGGRAGFQAGHLLVGASARTNGLSDGDEETRAKRYGLFALLGGKRFAVTAEADAGSDRVTADIQQNVQGAYLAGEIYLHRAWVVRAEFNYMDFEEDGTDVLSSVSRRYGGGVEWTPIPFLRLNAEARQVSNSNPTDSALDEFWTIGSAVFSF